MTVREFIRRVGRLNPALDAEIAIADDLTGAAPVRSVAVADDGRLLVSESAACPDVE